MSRPKQLIHLPKYVVSDPDRHGNQRYYFRAPGRPKVRLTETPGTEEFHNEVACARRGEPYKKVEEPVAMDDEFKIPSSRRRAEVLPLSLPPFGVNREQAAALLGISTTLFDWAAANGKMPRARVLKGRKIWDVDEIREFFKRLPHVGGEDDLTNEEDPNYNPWDDA